MTSKRTAYSNLLLNDSIEGSTGPANHKPIIIPALANGIGLRVL